MIRRNFLLLLLSMPLFSGCHAAAIDARADAKLADARASASRAIAYATCTDGARFGPSCGLIMRLAASDDFRARFRDKICLNRSTEECERLFGRLIDAELARRYFAADWPAVARACDVRPGLCEDGEAYEKLVMNSHNAQVQAKYGEDEDRIEGDRAREHRADAEATASAVGDLIETAAVLSGHRVCHSYPSVFGGVATVCNP